MSGFFISVYAKISAVWTTLAAPSGAYLIGYIQNSVGAMLRRVQDRLRDSVSVKDFGARGDGLGTTPADDGVDISGAAWNTWDGLPFKTNLPWSPYATGGGTIFSPPRAKPFENTDTWDFIGCQLALWQPRAVFVPDGTYVINLSGVNKGTYNGLLMMRGQEKVIFGSGPYATSFVTKEGYAFFAANNKGVNDYYKILTMYRTGGMPSNIREMAFVGPANYAQDNNNLSLIYDINTNGVTRRDLWLSTAHRGVSANDNSGDSHLSRTTGEFLFGDSVYTDATSEISIDFCNLWASAVGIPDQNGVNAMGRTSVTNSRLIGFFGSPCKAATGIFSHNFVSFNGAQSVSFTDDCIVDGNQISGSCAGPLIAVVKNASVIGNHLTNTSNHECLSIGNGTAASATNIAVSGNTFVKTNAAVEGQNYAITALQSGVGYTQAASASCLIYGNTFQGRAMQAIGSASVSKNTFDGVLQPAIFNESATFNAAVALAGETSNTGAITNTGSITNNGDMIGKTIMTGTQTATPFTVNVTGVIGAGSGAVREQTRMNLISVTTNGAGHVCTGYALYTNKYDGTAVLIATLGKTETGGTLVFGVAGNTPTFTCTNGGGAITYTVTAIPLI